MKTYKFIIFATILCGISFVTNIFATNLMDVYKQALASDPQFKAARAKWLADREGLAISKSALLPQLGATGSLTRTRSESENITGNPKNFNNNSSYGLQLTQSIFNFGSWASVWGAQAIAKQAQATFLAAEEDLLLRVSQRYFDVLLARDVLSYTKAHKEAVARLLNQAKHKYDVGLIPITDLEDARKNYDLEVANEIQAINDLSNKFEQLNEITGVRYFNLDPIKSNFPLLSPQPANIERWVKAAEQQNFELIAKRYASIAARENIKLQAAGHLPTLTAQGGYKYGYDDNGFDADSNIAAFNRSKVGSVSAQLELPIFQGGKVIASTNQANYQYQGALADQNKTYRATISNTRQNYLGVLSKISKIKADKQAIKSAQSSLRATQASYEVGTRTMADILNAESELYEVQKNFAKDEYEYIIQLLTLKQLTGILDAGDLEQINSWLEEPAIATKKVTATNKHPIKSHKTEAKIKKKSKAIKPKHIKTVGSKEPTDSKIVVISAKEVEKVGSDNVSVAPETLTEATTVVAPETPTEAAPIVAPVTTIAATTITSPETAAGGTTIAAPGTPEATTTAAVNATVTNGAATIDQQ